MNKTIILVKRPVGTPKNSDFKLIEEQKPEIKEGEMLLKTTYISVSG